MLLAILAMLPLAAVAAADAQAPAKPHIVFMLADGEPPAYLRPASAALLPRLLPRLLQPAVLAAAPEPAPDLPLLPSPLRRPRPLPSLPAYSAS